MACNLTGAIALDCLDSIGGVKTLWVSTNFDYTSVTAGATAGITAVSGGTGTFYQIEVAKDTASFTETFTVSNTNGTSFFEGSVTIPVQHLSSEKRQQIQLLAYNRASRVLIEDNNGALWLIGLTRGCTLTTGSTTTGTAVGDATQYSFVLTAQEPEMAYQVASLSALSPIAFVNA